MAYLNKIKILDDKNQTSSTTPFNFGIGTLREENGNIVYDGDDGKQKILLAKGTTEGTYTLKDTVLQEYMDQRDTFLKDVKYDPEKKQIVFTFVVGNGEIEDGVEEDLDSREEVIRVPVNDFAIDADNIFFTFDEETIRLTEAFGRYKPSERGYAEVPLKDDKGNKYSLQDFFQNAYQVVNNSPGVQDPSASIKLYKNSTSIATSNIVAEVGSTPTVYFKVEYTDGSFQYAGSAGCEWNGGSVECREGFNNNIELDKIQSLKAGQIQLGENYVMLTYAYGSSTTQATNNLGKDIDQVIPEADNQTATAAYYIQGNYYAYGGSSENELSSDAAAIKNLKSKGNSKASSFPVTINEGASHIMIAVPSGRKITKIADGNAFGTDILSTFTQEDNVVSVTFGEYSKDYTVYKYSTDTKLKQNILTVSLTNG